MTKWVIPNTSKVKKKKGLVVPEVLLWTVSHSCKILLNRVHATLSNCYHIAVDRALENNIGVIFVFVGVTTTSGKDCAGLLNAQGFCSCHGSILSKKHPLVRRQMLPISWRTGKSAVCLGNVPSSFHTSIRASFFDSQSFYRNIVFMTMVS